MNHQLGRKFRLGRTVTTPAVVEVIHPEDMLACLQRHASGDWGDCGEEDRQENDLSLQEGFRILSVYHDRHGTEFWIITEADRSVTTFLLPSEY